MMLENFPFWQIIVFVVAIGLTVLWAELLRRLAKMDRPVLFYVVLGAPHIASFVSLVLFAFANIIGFILLLLWLIVFIFYGEALRMSGGSKQTAWFYLIFLFPPLLIVYHLTN